MAVLIRKRYYEIDLEHWAKYWGCSEDEARKRFNDYSDEDLNIMFKSYDKSEWLEFNKRKGE